jgi:hypothetical protein
MAALHADPPLERLWSALARPRATWAIIAVAVLLIAPCIATDFVLDDYVLAIKSRAPSPIAGLPTDPLWLFTFTTGDPVRNQALIDEGVMLPWWSDPRHLNAFFRPLTSLTHVFDFRFWPSSPALMHLHSLFWYALALFVLSRVYRALEPDAPRLAGLSLLLFAWDDAHGATVGWIANRNALIAVALALPALITHHRAATGSRAAAWLGPICFALGLCAGETAISVAGYLLAYALCLDRRSTLQRAMSLAPYVVLLLAHRGLYRLFDLGSFGSIAYHDPLHEPFEFIAALGYNLPVLLSAELLLPLSDFAYWGAPELRLPLWVVSVLGLLALGGALVEPLRDARARFWTVGLVLAAIPVSASLPGDRLLLVMGIGACPLIARLLLAAAAAWPAARAAQLAARSPRRVGMRADIAPSTARVSWPLMAALALIHGVIAPCTLPLRAAAFGPVTSIIDRFDTGIPNDLAVRDKTVVVVNAPVTVMLSYLQIQRAALAEPRPAQLLVLASSSSEVSVERTGPARLRVELAEGFLRRPEETHYRADKLTGTDRVALRGLHIDVASRTPDGRPKAIVVTFDEPLESSRYLLRAYRNGRLEPWQPPAAGSTDRFPAQDFFRLLGEELVR